MAESRANNTEFRPGHEPLIEPDVGTRAVKRFYAMLLSDQPPTREDEREIFTDSSTLKTYLERNADRATDTPLCDFFRKQADQFLPEKRPEQAVPSVTISSLATWASNLQKPKHVGSPGTGFVIAIYSAGGQDGEKRYVWFWLFDGKIDPGAIRTDGRFGDMMAVSTIPMPPRQRP